MTKPLVIASIVFTLVGCSTAGQNISVTKPGITQKEWAKDVRDCQSEAKWSLTRDSQRATTKACLEQRGYKVAQIE